MPLKKLDLGVNQLTSLPASVGDLPLQLLVVESNKPRGLPDIVAKLKKAKIYAKGNRLPKADRDALKRRKNVYL